MVKIKVFDEKTGVPATDNDNRMLNMLMTHASDDYYASCAINDGDMLPRKLKKEFKKEQALYFAREIIQNMFVYAQKVIAATESREN